jgi:hypothetical protein
MQEIFDKLEFRAFSYEEDPEAIADMHCSSETLEGYWFDKAETCKMHSKIVVKCPGSDWVLAYYTVIFAHVSLVKMNEDEISAISLRVHENYRYPQVVKALIEGLKREAIKRNAKAILVFADNSQIDSCLQSIGLRPDRGYQYVNVAQRTTLDEKPRILRSERVVYHHIDITHMKLIPMLGAPLPYTYTLHRALHGADYAVFSHEKPTSFNIFHQNNLYFACHDGREWHLYKKDDFKVEKEILPSLLNTLASLKPGQILLSEKTIELLGISPTNNRVFNDYLIKI